MSPNFRFNIQYANFHHALSQYYSHLAYAVYQLEQGAEVGSWLTLFDAELQKDYAQELMP